MPSEGGQGAWGWVEENKSAGMSGWVVPQVMGGKLSGKSRWARSSGAGAGVLHEAVESGSWGVERGLREVDFCSMEIAGERPSIESRSGLPICSRNWRA